MPTTLACLSAVSVTAVLRARGQVPGQHVLPGGGTRGGQAAVHTMARPLLSRAGCASAAPPTTQTVSSCPASVGARSGSRPQRWRSAGSGQRRTRRPSEFLNFFEFFFLKAQGRCAHAAACTVTQTLTAAVFACALAQATCVCACTRARVCACASVAAFTRGAPPGASWPPAPRAPVCPASARACGCHTRPARVSGTAGIDGRQMQACMLARARWGGRCEFRTAKAESAATDLVGFGAHVDLAHGTQVDLRGGGGQWRVRVRAC